MIRALLLAVLAAGALAAWRLTRPTPPEPPRWIEDDDGVQPADPYVWGIADYVEHGWRLVAVPRETS